MRNNRKAIIGFLISALFLVLIFYNVDFKSILETFKQFNIRNLLMIVGMYGFSLFVRGYRWQLLLKSDTRFSLYRLCSTWIVGSLMNAFLPARAGDVWRAYELGVTTNESKMKLFGGVMLERIFDGVSICCILYFCIMAYANLLWIRRFADIAAWLFGGTFLLFYLIVRYEKITNICKFCIGLVSKFPEKIRDKFKTFILKLCHQAQLFVSGFDALKSTYYVIQVSLMSFVIWALECLVTYWVLISFGINCPISATAFVVCFVALGTMIPSSSVFVGPYQLAYILALGIYFIPKSEALAVAIVQQSILMGTLLIFAIICSGINFALKIIDCRQSAQLETENNLPQEVLK